MRLLGDHLFDAQPDRIPIGIGDLQDGRPVHRFLQQKYLNWLEALSLAQAMSRGVLVIETLNSLLHVCSKLYTLQ